MLHSILIVWYIQNELRILNQYLEIKDKNTKMPPPGLKPIDHIVDPQNALIIG